MSTPPNPPERLAEILLEILALSDSGRTAEPEPIKGPNRIHDANCVEPRLEQPSEDNDRGNS
jgi:hypothetical protein